MAAVAQAVLMQDKFRFAQQWEASDNTTIKMHHLISRQKTSEKKKKKVVRDIWEHKVKHKAVKCI